MELRGTVMRIVAWAGVAVSLSACSFGGKSVDGEIAAIGDRAPEPSRFTICYNHGCRRAVETGFSAAEWAELAAIFAGRPADARAERGRIAQALARAEQIVGPKTGTDGDLGGSFPGIARSGQLDCVDEMRNAGTYLSLFDRAGFLQFHALGRRVSSSFFHRAAWTHTVMTIAEKESRTEYIVDTWADDNGALPYIMTFRDWDAGETLARAY